MCTWNTIGKNDKIKLKEASQAKGVQICERTEQNVKRAKLKQTADKHSVKWMVFAVSVKT